MRRWGGDRRGGLGLGRRGEVLVLGGIVMGAGVAGVVVGRTDPRDRESSRRTMRYAVEGRSWPVVLHPTNDRKNADVDHPKHEESDHV